MLLQLSLLACLCLTANGFVDYGDSVLYDEYDLSIYKTFPLPECLASSCKVYVSAPEASLPILEKIYLGDTTLASLARRVDNSSGLKTAYTIKPYSGKAFIANWNWKFASAPVAVYVVYERASYFSSAAVYEPSSAPLTVQWRNAYTLTFLSATNFTLSGDVNATHFLYGKVIPGGFDSVHLNRAHIPALHYFSNESTFDFSFNSPLVTLYTPYYVDVEVEFESGFDESSSSNTFLTSPGYTGVLSGQVYRSSLYNKTVHYRLTYEKETNVHFQALLNTFNDVVDISVDGGENISLHGTRGLPSYYQFVDVHGGINFDISFTKTSPFSSFLLYIKAEEVAVEPETTTESAATTDSAPISTIDTETSEPSEVPVTSGPVVPSDEPVTSGLETETPSGSSLAVQPVTELPTLLPSEAPIHSEITTAPLVPEDPVNPLSEVPAPVEARRVKFPVYPIV